MTENKGKDEGTVTAEQPSPREKGRYWAGLIYPDDSCPEDWMERMQQSGLQILVSPVHDKDVNKETGELKKPHRHVVAMWANPTTRRNAERFFEQFGGPKKILKLSNPVGMARYLIHLDDPQKKAYDPKDIVEINGADWRKLALADSKESEAMQIVNVIGNHEIPGYYDLLCFLKRAHPELLGYAISHTGFCRETIWSYRNNKEQRDRAAQEQNARKRLYRNSVPTCPENAATNTDKDGGEK